jgi:hypothetical protein
MHTSSLKQACRNCNVMSIFMKDASQQAHKRARDLTVGARTQKNPGQRDTGHNARKHAAAVKTQSIKQCDGAK